MTKKRKKPIFKIGYNVRRFLVQRYISNNTIKEYDETLVPDDVLKVILENQPDSECLDLARAYKKLKKMPLEALLEKRYQKFRRIGKFKVE